jgi:hypothetical protein
MSASLGWRAGNRTDMPDGIQKANTFDMETLKSIGKGCLIALAGTFATWLAANVDVIAATFSSKPMVASALTALLSIAANVIYQYTKGEKTAA